MKRVLLLSSVLLCFGFLMVKAQQPVTLTGKISNLKTGGKINALTAFVYELAMDDDVNFITQIQPDGSFKIAIPLDHPTEIRLETGNTVYIYCRPGTSLSVSWDALHPKETLQFQGEDAVLNVSVKKYMQELERSRKLRGSYDSQYSLVKNIPANYKKFEYDNLEQDLHFYEDFLKHNEVSDLFKKIEKYNLEYNCASNLMRYRWNLSKGVKLPEGYFDFFNRFKPENRDALISPMYTEMFLHEYLMYTSDEIRRQAETTNKNKSETPESTASFAKAMLGSPGLTDDENAKFTILSKMPDQKKIQAADSIFLSRFTTDHQSLVMEKFAPPDPVIDYCITQPSGLLRNLLFAHELYALIDANYPQLIKQYIDPFTKLVGDEALKNKILGLYNDRMLKLTRYVPNENAHFNDPISLAGDSLFQKLTVKYRGTVIYIDFWATWCGPCRQEIPGSQQLKKELAGKPVTFLYLGVQSPADTWKAVIAELKIDGEHYLLDNTEYQLLSNRFQISGIPHYVLVDPTGKPTGLKALSPAEPELKKQILTLIAR